MSGAMHIDLLCVGKLKEPFYRDAVAEYTKRLGGYCQLRVTELAEERLPEKPSAAQIQAALAREGTAILQKLPPRAGMIALCVEGALCSSEALAQLLQAAPDGGESRLAFVIGGSFGLDARVKDAAKRRLSMSPMTFPHHLARVMLLEQIYRGFKICAGSGYHK